MVPQLHSFLCKMKNIFYKMFLFFKLFLNRTNNPHFAYNICAKKRQNKIVKRRHKKRQSNEAVHKKCAHEQKKVGLSGLRREQKKLFVQLATGWATSWQKVQHPLVAGQRCVRVHRYPPISTVGGWQKKTFAACHQKMQAVDKRRGNWGESFRKVK